jgi:hypothetical protein
MRGAPQSTAAAAHMPAAAARTRITPRSPDVRGHQSRACRTLAPNTRDVREHMPPMRPTSGAHGVTLRRSTCHAVARACSAVALYFPLPALHDDGGAAAAAQSVPPLRRHGVAATEHSPS